jgi:hypothetical protein
MPRVRVMPSYVRVQGLTVTFILGAVLLFR